MYANNGNVKYGDVGVEDYLLLLLFVSFIYNTQGLCLGSHYFSTLIINEDVPDGMTKNEENGELCPRFSCVCLSDYFT